jgi:RES domain-containing protein
VNLEGDAELLPDFFQLIKAEAAENVSLEVLDAEALPPDWREDTVATQAMGDAWLKGGGSALLAVPSVPSPESLNYLFNPLHKDAAGVRIAWCKRLVYDRRLFRAR